MSWEFCFMTKNKPLKLRKIRLVEGSMWNSGKHLQRLWKATLKSNLHAKDKSEILRLLIFAFTVISIIALFVLERL